MKKKHKPLIVIGVIVAAVVGLFVWNAMTPGQYDDFAACLEEKGAKFYGAFWCSACDQQKQLFGKSEKKLPYVECSPNNRQGQLPVCVDADIQGYPTWEFADGERQTGVLDFETLAERTGCVAPE